ncbi:response regulator [candidate division CSSED10-310 bacterium]|uniref:Response regulator n=1 Tax=candidate division CSSED10-310 bacterium TaxID=2855610 RepID=A0ABV6Z593_UNCC1
MKINHILVADDEKHTRFTLSLIFRKAGFEVTAVASGREALNRIIELRNSLNPLDLLVIDIQMPGLTGFELIEEIEHKNILLPILIISGYPYREMVKGLEQRFCIEYLEKPFEPEELLNRIYLIQDKHEHSQRKNNMDSNTILEIVEKHRGKLGSILSILQEIQFTYGYLPEKALRIVSDNTGDSLVDIYGIATFHDKFKFYPPDKKTDIKEEHNYAPDVRCPSCNHSLMQPGHFIDDRPAVRVTVSFGMEHGWLRFSSWCGAYNIEVEYDLPAAGEVNLFCPHCHVELFAANNCTVCGAPMVPMIEINGKMIQVCSYVGCKSHILAVEYTYHTV